MRSAIRREADIADGTRSPLKTGLLLLGSTLLGLFLGLALTLAVVVARARFLQYYLESEADLLGIPGVAAAVALVVVPVIVWRGGGRVLLALTMGTFAGLLPGVLAGWGFARLTSTEPTDHWAGGIIGGGVLAAICAVWCAAVVSRRPRAAVNGAASDAPSTR